MSSNHTTIVTGTLVAIENRGVLINGTPGSGKSELALALIDRGHQLVADDRIFIQRHPQQPCLLGSATDQRLAGFIAVRNLGILHADRLFQHNAVQAVTSVDLIITLKNHLHKHEHEHEHERIHGRQQTVKLLEVAICQIFLAVDLRRRLDILVEVALRQSLLRKEQNYDSSKHFCQQQQTVITHR